LTFKAGDEKPAKAGRKKGTPNKRTNKVLELLKEQGYDPLVEAIKMLQKPSYTDTEKKKMYQEHIEICNQDLEDPKSPKEFYSEFEALELTAKDRLDGHIKLIKYVYPARKAIEIKSDNNSIPPTFTISLTKPEET
jgi:hypothetical protein